MYIAAGHGQAAASEAVARYCWQDYGIHYSTRQLYPVRSSLLNVGLPAGCLVFRWHRGIETDFVSYVDADFANYVDDRHEVFNFLFFLCSGLSAGRHALNLTLRLIL